MTAIVALCAAVGGLAPARASTPDGGTAAGALRALELEPVDGGFAVEAASPDAGAALAVVPPELLMASPAEYPEDMGDGRVAGTVQLELLIGESGAVEEAVVASAVDPKLDAAAVTAARKLRFRPAELGGKPIAVRMRFDYEFCRRPVPAAAAPSGPKATVAGVVRARGRRTPIAGAHVESAGSAVTTDADGRFTLEVAVGEQALRVSAPGFRAGTYRETLEDGVRLEVIYGLEPLRANPYETIVRGERERTEVSRVTLRDQELREVPGTMGDPFRVVMLMPGVGSMLSGVAYPVVRGSPPAATGYFIDGIQVPLLFHLLLGPAVVHPDVLETVDFFPGSPPPKYGRLIGGVIDGRVARPREEMVRGSFYADLINAGGFVEYPFKQTGTSLTVAGRIAYTAWITSLLVNSMSSARGDEVVLAFWDYQARVEQSLGGGKLRVFALGSSDTFGFTSAHSSTTAFGAPGAPDPAATDAMAPSPSTQSTPQTQMQKIAFHRLDLRYRHPAAVGEYELGATWGTEIITAGGSALGVGGAVAGSEDFALQEDTYGARAGWTAPLGRQLRLETGADVVHRRPHLVSTLKIEDSRLDIGQTSVAATFFGAWARLTWETDDKVWSVGPGLRFDNFHANNGANYAVLEPRFGARWQVSDRVALKGGAGLYHQQPVTLISVPLVDTATLKTGIQAAAQFSVGSEWKVTDGIEMTAETFFDPLLRTIELVPNANIWELGNAVAANPSSPSGYESSGYAYGLELMLRHPIGRNWFGWIAYTLQRSTRRVKYSVYDTAGIAVGEHTAFVPYAFDQTHILNAVVGYKFAGNWSLGVAVHYNSGRPETAVATSMTQREYDGAWVPVTVSEAARLPGFFRVDFRASKAWVFDVYELELYLDVLNLSLQKEVIGYQYQYDNDLTQVPPRPGVPVKTVFTTPVPITIPMLGLRATY